ncbi:ATP-grasp fold amidoligase family protein [Rhodohalobacter halophilus]|uniref:ATP-grasp fold amidoligase family protein n=1 Tax=Rhodohalobacter halophilus TaxID=1812810 RepID=UPI00083FC64E|nr:ATP-grasp fold amidoligase family protein [Rhodohalobacter halophilus]
MKEWFLRKLFWGGLHKILSDVQYAKIRYRLDVGRKLNLKTPQSFTEKIQYVKLYDRNPLRKMAASRKRVREYVKDQIGEEYLIPLVLETSNLTAREWETLPDQFVLKANHGCGMIEIIDGKQNVDFLKIAQITREWQEFNYAKFGREWVYEDAKRDIIAEELLLNQYNEIPKDYKLFCFHGRVALIQVDIGRFEKQRRNLYDRNFNLLPVTSLYPNSENPITPPGTLDEMIEVAEKLSSEFNFIRVDLYSVGNKVYFGELTNFPGNGFISYQPDWFDFELGENLQL